MDVLKQEVERARNILTNKKLLVNEVPTTMLTKKVYIKRGALNNIEPNDIKKQKINNKVDDSIVDDINTEVKVTNDINNNRSEASNESIIKSSELEVITDRSTSLLSRDLIIKSLRSYNQPIVLFGETLVDMSKRLEYIELLRSENIELSGNKSQINQFKLNNILIDKELLENAAYKDIDNDKLDYTLIDTFKKLINGNIEEVKNFRLKYEHADDYVLYFLKTCIKVWEIDLDLRTDNEKRSSQGKFQQSTWLQTKTYLKPLFKLLKKRSVEKNVMEFFDIIVQRCCEKEYVQANDVYMQLSIGNKAWPIGVTNSCMHERSADDKLAEKNVAHVLNDETQRKYIQSFKRLMTFTQNKYPNASGSKNCG